jgi:hypothetical protein
VTHVFNLTDIDDRIINEAARRRDIDEFTAPYITAFWEDFDALGMERPEVTPRATHHIPEMIEIIAKLLENGHAYESDGSIYYRITAFPDYGKLSRIRFDGNIAGAATGSTPTNTTRKTHVISRFGSSSVKPKNQAGTLIWTRSAGLAYRVLCDVDEISRRDFRHTRRWPGPAVSASRERDRPERRRNRQAVCQVLDPQRVPEDRRRDDVEI